MLMINVALRMGPRTSREALYYEQTLQTVREHTRRMSGILDGLLQLSRAEALEHLELEPVDVSRIVARRLDEYTSKAAARQVALERAVTSGIVASVEPGHLDIVLDNLVDNAIKYTPPGGSVRLSLSRKDETVALRVSDTGAGFTEEERHHLFDRFYRADTPLIQQARGSGLGLSIARALVEAYGGQITASSDGPGAGSLFEVMLPLR